MTYIFCEQIIKRAAEQNWDENRLTDFLTQRSLPSDHVQVFINVWNKEAGKVEHFEFKHVILCQFLRPISSTLQINKKLLQDVTWNDTLERLTWRVDVRALSKTSAEQSDEPIAFFELATKKPTSRNSTKASSAKFEMNREEAGKMLATLNEIDLVFQGLL